MTVIETSGTTRYDDAPFSASTTDNWVARKGGLPPYVRAVARGIMKSGQATDESQAIQMAIGVIKRWAKGGSTYGHKSHASAATIAKAAAAVAHWEAMKAATREAVIIARAVEAHELERTEAYDEGGVRAQQKGKKGKKGSGNQGGKNGSKNQGKNGNNNQQNQQGAAAAQNQQGRSKSSQTAGKTASQTVKKEMQQKQQQKAAAQAQQGGGHPWGRDLKPGQGQQPQMATGVAQGQAAAAKAASTPVTPVKSGGGSGSGSGKGTGSGSKPYVQPVDLNAIAQAITQAQNEVQNATDAANQSAQRVTSAQNELSAAQAEAQNDVAYAEAKEKNTPQGVQGASAVQSASQSGSSRVQSAQSSLSAAQLADQAAQDRLTQAQAALAKWQRSAGPGMALLVRDFGALDGAVGEGNPAGVNNPSGAALLLPVGPSKKQAKTVQDVLKAEDPTTQQPHRFAGGNLGCCATCGKPIGAKVHQAENPNQLTIQKPVAQPIPPVPRTVGGGYTGGSFRHAGPGHLNVPTGHIAGSPARHAAAAGATARRHIAAVEEPLATSLRSHFQDQRQSVLSRLTGDRGKRMLKRAAEELRAPQDGEQDEGVSGEEPPQPPSIASPGAIFDAAYWTKKTADVLGPHLDTASNLAAESVKSQIRLDPMTDDSTSVGNMKQIIADRAAMAATYISGTTSKDLTSALQQGVAQGEGIAEIAKRVNDVFDRADIVRAKQIAQTETVGAYNEGAHAYADGLPPDVVGSRRWLSHHDPRTRTTHRIADGQEQPKGAPFYVGGAAMMYPGDKAAPVGEWINCRCSVAYMPPEMSYGGIAAQAAAYVAGLKATPPPAVSKVDVTGVQ